MPKRIKSANETCPGHNILVTGNTTSIQDLPVEVLLAIFINLPLVEILITIPLVCQRWYDLHDDYSLYRHLIFRGNEPETSVAVRLVSMATRLKSIKLASRDDTDEILRHVAARNNPLLKSLKMRSGRGSGLKHHVSTFILERVVIQCPNLQRLSLRETSVGMQIIFNEIWDHLPLLNAIDFGPTCKEVTLFNNAEQFVNLSYLRICNNATDNVIRRYCEMNADALNIVKLVCWSCYDPSLKALRTCHLINTLYLDYAVNITDEGIMNISELPHLLKLHISQNDKITSACWIRFFKKPHMKRLTELFIDTCVSVNDNVTIAIATNLSELKKLSLKDQWGSDISDTGIMEISKLQKLEHLVVSCTGNVTSVCWMTLFQSNNMKRIKHLTLDCCENVNNYVCLTIALKLVELEMLSLIVHDDYPFANIRHMLPKHCVYNFKHMFGK